MSQVIVSHCRVSSSSHASMPNGDLTAYGTVGYFTNKAYEPKFNPVKITDINVINSNNVSFFTHKELTSSALKAIANTLIEIANNAEEAQKKLIDLNK